MKLNPARILLAAVLTLTLGGCAAVPSGDISGLIPTVRPEPTASATAAPPRELAAGDPIPVGAVLPAHQSAYLMLDGRNVVIERAAAATPEVLADVRTRVLPLNHDEPNPGLWIQQVRIAQSVSKTMIICQLRVFAIHPDDGSNPNAGPQVLYSMVIRGNFEHVFKVEAEADAFAAQYIAEHGGAEAGWQLLKTF